MWERFCPTIQRPCIDGLADGEDLVCAFWDSLDGKCGFVAGMTAARSYEEALEPMRKYMQEAGLLQNAKEALNRNLDESIAKAKEAREAPSRKAAEHHEQGAD